MTNKCNPPEVSPRQLQILELAAKGWTNKRIARALYITEATVKTHLARLTRAVMAPNRAALIIHAHVAGWLSLGCYWERKYRELNDLYEGMRNE